MIGISINPTNPFQGEAIGYHVDFVWILGLLLYLEVAIRSNLLRLVYGLYDYSYTSFVMRILSVIPVQVTNPLLCSVLLLHPVLYEVLNLFNVQELNVVHMSILLSFDKHVRRNTFVAHGFRIRFMILAFSINFISDLRRWKAIIALYVRRMNALTLKFLLFQKLVKRYVSCIRYELFIEAMDTFCMRPMLAYHLAC